MINYNIRQATIDDLDTILHHRRRMFEDMGHTDTQALDAVVAASRPLLQQNLETGSYHGWFIVTPEGEIAAGGGIIFLDFQPNPRDPRPQRAWVVNMFTEPVHRKRGLARLLMKTMLEWCRTQGMKTLFLHASDYGRPLYESLGFTPNNEMRINL